VEFGVAVRIQGESMSPALIWIALVLFFVLLLALAKAFLSFAMTQMAMFLVGIGVIAAGVVQFLNRPRK